MRAFFRQIKIFQFFAFLNLVFFILLTVLIVRLSALWYAKLPSDDPLRARFKLGKFLTKLEFAYIFYDWRKLGLPVYDVDITEKNLNKIHKGLPPKDVLMTEEYRDYVKAKFSCNGKTYDVKTRVRGLTPNHWMDEKKSWRIKFESDELFNRKKAINLIIPQDRGFFAEYLSNHIARKFGLLTPDDNFVFLRINGILQGIYYEIEHPTAKFLEYHGKIDTANFYREDNWDWFKYGFDPVFSDTGHWKKNTAEKISPFDNYAELDYLLFLLNRADDARFYREIPALVNMDNFLRWQAHSMIMGSYHQSEHGNENLYFNIIDGKFEFMPYDVGIFPFTEQFFDKAYNPLVTRLLRNPEYLHCRNIILWSYLNNGNNPKKDLALYDDIYKRTRKAFYADRKKGFTNAYFDSEVRNLINTFTANREKIITNLNFASIFVNIHIFPAENNILAVLDMVSQGFSAAELLGLKVAFEKDNAITEAPDLALYYDSNNTGAFESSDTHISKFSLDAANNLLKTPEPFSFMLYPGRDEKLQPSKKNYKFFLVCARKDLVKKEQFNLELEVDNAVTKAAVAPRYHYINDRDFARFNEVTQNADTFAQRNPIFKQDASGSNAFIIPAGEHRIDSTIIVPGGINIIIEPGAILKFAKGVSFISYGKVLAKGVNDRPIIFTAADNKEPWGNFAVVGHASDNSDFEYVIIEYGGESFVNGIYFTGALAIHSSLARIRNCLIRYNTGDDAVNVKTGECFIEMSVFHKNHSDCVDYDFSKGIVKNNYIKDNGGDGFDLCRSEVHIEKNRIEGSGDKGISVGEASKPTIVDNLIRFCNIGIASKDMSMPYIVNNTIIENNNGIEVYTKKQVFGPAGGIMRNSVIWGNKISLKILSGSSLDIADTIIEAGYDGMNISKVAPDFLDKKSGNYQLSATEAGIKANIEALRQVPDYKDVIEAPIGILSNPVILSLTDFSDR